ncbi:NADH-quinone oxidoreductase subunit NuoF [Myxococcota bacterium]|nr:NADH-quinone oxidoreductase subunit NuoF [Myxococcota bacterium]MBU1429301.1 NADH-quinone oxidoreductase subunit NuoF [Myxococcota bacterium]MBU1899313.1 NADH-quinone oxidoreductase subunit NuoF [Myxococcota bacterium]
MEGTLSWRLFGPRSDAQARESWYSGEGVALKREAVERLTLYIGAGTCGLGAGAGETLKAVKREIKARGIEADIIEVGCVGLCSAEPILDAQRPGQPRVSFAHVTHDKVKPILDALLDRDQLYGEVLGQYDAPPSTPPRRDALPISVHPFFRAQHRRVLSRCGIIDPVDIHAYIAHGGFRALADTIHQRTPEEACEAVIESGLRGRGGGGFPTGVKWRFALKEGADQKYLICNADEGDPGAFMDRAVIEGDPYRLIEGMALAAYAIGATKAYVYIRAEYPLAIARLRRALDQARAWGLLGANIMDSGFDLDVYVKEGAGAFVCGEETALIHSIEGKRGMPRPRPPFPASRGLFNCPTIINNVETLANLPDILPDRAAEMAALGTASSKGTKVFALSGKVKHTGLVEVEMGTTVRQIVMEIGGGCPNGKAFKAAQIGGPSGGCIPTQHLDIEVDYESLKTVGAMMGSGGLVVMDEDTCMVDVAKFFMDFIQRESCGKCIPCREGTRRMLEILEQITRRRGQEGGFDALHRMQGVAQLEKLAGVIADTSLCGLGQSAPSPVLSTLRFFRDEYEAHVFERRCPAGACEALKRYSIIEEACVGCTLCKKACPTDAILGSRKNPHYIIEERCIGCGACLDACRLDAVAVAR